ncbi:hypothetical protein AB3S75_031883 [Citrus x aurantiifolia]
MSRLCKVAPTFVFHILWPTLKHRLLVFTIFHGSNFAFFQISEKIEFSSQQFPSTLVHWTISFTLHIL